jgi:hypothetical protein
MVGGELPPPRNGAMKIELRNVKHSAALSEETAHFLAEIWIDGEEAGTARNQGTGGATRILPHHLGERLESYARSLPPLKTKFGALTQSADTLLSDAFDFWQAKRKLQRAFKTKGLYLRGGKLYETQKLNGMQMTSLRRQGIAWLAHLGAEQLLNTMPIDEAVELVMRLEAEGP